MMRDLMSVCLVYAAFVAQLAAFAGIMWLIMWIGGRRDDRG